MAIQPSELGVRCESCHGPGSDHVQAIVDGRASEAAALIKNPGRLAPRDLIAHCGTCHRPPASEPHEVDFSDPWNTRHQPVYFTQSRCFQESDELTCMTCHDPHGRVLRNAAGFYRNRCLGCHADESRSPAAACGEPSQADCANCHMPKVQPHEHLAFTNHWIGVFDNPDSLVPRRSAR